MRPAADEKQEAEPLAPAASHHDMILKYLPFVDKQVLKNAVELQNVHPGILVLNFSQDLVPDHCLVLPARTWNRVLAEETAGCE